MQGAAEKKRTERGGFEEGLLLVETEEVPLVGRDMANLFAQGNVSQAGGRIVERSGRGDITDDAKRVRPVNRGVRLSLVPPSPGGRRRFILPLRGLELEAVVEYTEKEIVVNVQSPSPAERDRQQMWLPFDQPE